METLSRLRIGLLLELHGIRPGPLGADQWDVDETLVRLLACQLANGHVASFEVPLVALGVLQGLPQSTDAAAAVSAVPLEITVAQAVLLLGILYHVQNCSRSESSGH